MARGRRRDPMTECEGGASSGDEFSWDLASSLLEAWAVEDDEDWSGAKPAGSRSNGSRHEGQRPEFAES